MDECTGNGLGLKGATCSTTNIVWEKDVLGLGLWNEFTGNRPGLRGMAYFTTGLVWATGCLGLGLWGLEGDSLGLGALLARNHDNQPFLGLGRRRVGVEMAHQTYNHIHINLADVT